jgi:hypothetical protein
MGRPDSAGVVVTPSSGNWMGIGLGLMVGVAGGIGLIMI